jgi:transposase
MKSIREFQGVFFHREPVDMRKSINGLSELVESAKMGELMGPNLFVFSNRRRELLKVLYFDKSGFALWIKRLEKAKFPWPKKHESAVMSLSPEQFEWLLDGYDIWKVKPFEKLSYARVS